MNKQLGAVVTAWGLLVGISGLALAELKAVDPGPYTAATGQFPLWYEDNAGVNLELCRSKALSPTGGYLCTLIPDPGVYDDTQPLVFPSNWPSELFWFLAETSLPNSGIAGYNLEVYVAGVEAAFANELPRDGDQQAFTRIRVRAAVPAGRLGVYTITHPYGVETVNVTQGGRRAIDLTRDIGIAAPGVFTEALKGDVGPFLARADGTRISASDPETGEAEVFIGDPNVPTLVSGGLNGVNYVEISGPAGTIRSELFSLSGKLYNPEALPPTAVEVQRSTYSRDSTGSRIAVFARTPQSSNTSACYRETLALVPGTTPSPCLIEMTGDGRGYFFAHNPNPQSLPSSVIVTASDLGGTTRPTAVASPLTDVVKISSARFARDSGTLTIEASSSDELEIPDLAAAGFGRLNKSGVLQTLTVSGLSQPPARVTVRSAAGGMDSEPVSVVGRVPPTEPNLPPLGVADSGSTAPGVALELDVLANDSDPENNTPLRVASVTQPSQGSVTLTINGSALRYSPPATVATAFTASFSYRAQDSLGAISEPIAVNVAVSASPPPNQPPVAGTDSASTTAPTPVTINVLANDSDPDNHLPLSVAAVSTLQPALGTVVHNGDGTLTYTPPATVADTFTASFTYTLSDSQGATATGIVNVRVSPPVQPPVLESSVSVTTATVTRRTNNRYNWTLSGTSSQPLNNTLTVTVTTLDGPRELGTARPNRNNGRWSVAVRNSSLIPTATPVATIRESNGATRIVNVSSQ